MTPLRRALGAVGCVLLLVVGLLYGFSELVATPAASQSERFPLPPPGSSSAAGRPAGLVQEANSKTSCIYIRVRNYDLPASLASVQKETGIRYDCLETYENAETTWSAWVEPWVTKPQYGYTRWLAADPRGRTVVLTFNLVPDSVAETPDWRATCARGAYRDYARQLSKRLVATGFRYSVIRLGPEMNGTWYRDSIGSDATQWRQWALCYAQIVSAMRSVQGAHFLFDWNVNAGYQTIPLEEYYPGDAYVNIVGVDAYDVSPSQVIPPPSTRRWQALSTEPLGLVAVARFATAHGKPLSIPEWGTQEDVGDDAYYVQAMGRFVLTHRVAYQCWFDSGTGGVLTLSKQAAPESLAAYVAAFGPGSPVAAFQARSGG